MKNILSGLGSLGKKIISSASYAYLFREFANFTTFINIYIKDKIVFLTRHFEGQKGNLVRNILIKRGKRNRIFLHISAMVVLTVGIIVSPLISDTNIFGSNPNLSFAQGSTSSLTTADVFNTQESQKPRDKIIKYTVQPGDTLSTVAKKFGISTNTIKWQNNMTSDDITVGDTLEILPVTGVAHKVAPGDTVYTIAKKYKSDPQAIVDFPFNDFANPQTFSLVDGEILIVPDGVPPAAAPTYVRQTYLAVGAPSVPGASGFAWPIHGTLNQSYSWYHPGVDLGDPLGTPIASATNGHVAQVFTSGYNGGYGIHVIIAGDNGYTTLYAHMMGVNVSVGQEVVAGRTIVGWIGLTGRTTGPHLHFEVHPSGGGTIDPLGVLQ